MRLQFITLLFAALAAATGAAHGAAVLPVSIPSLEQELQTSALDDEARASAGEDLAAASAALEEAAALRERLAELQLEAETLSEQQLELEARLEAGPAESVDAWRDRLPEETETATLEELLDNQRATLETLDEDIDSVSEALVGILAGPASAAGEIGALEQRIARLESETAPSELPADLEERVLLVRSVAELDAARAALALREFETEWATQRQALYELRLRELHLRREVYVERVDILQTRVATQGRTQLAALVTVLTQRAAQLADGPEVVASVAATNAALAAKIAQHSDDLAEERTALAESMEARDTVSGTLNDARIRLEVGGTSQLVGRWLWSERQRLEAPASIQRRLADLRDDLASLRLEEIVLAEEQAALVDVRAASRGLSARGAEAAQEGGSAVETTAALAPLLRQQLELLSLKEPLLRQRIETLEEREQVLLQTAEESLELQRLFDRYLLSAPSHAPVGLDWLQRIPQGVAATVGVSQVADAITRIRQPTMATLGVLVPGAILLVVLFVLQRRAVRGIDDCARLSRGTEPSAFRATLVALGWTLLAALPLPVVFFLLGAYLRDVGSPGAIGYSAGVAIDLLALPLYAVLVLNWASRKQGLGHRHFRWTDEQRLTLRRVLPVAFTVILPMVFLASLAVAREQDLSSDVSARLAIVVASLTFAASLWYALGPGRLWMQPSSLRKLLRVVLTLLVASVAWFALQGFVYSAGRLFLDILQTFTALVAVTLAVGLVGRWLLLGERRLAAARQEETAQPEAEADGENEEDAVAAEPELSLEEVNAQTGRLLSALRIGLVAGVVLWVWSEALPAFTRLEEITLWRVAVVGVDGQAESQAITLLAVLAGVVALMITVAGARNLPGLIEIVLANYTTVDAPSRYAVTSVLRYAIVIAGTLLALALVGMQWSRLQWLAAGLTVGLGFGLQEIFANFISGLILLFERPFRVGDVITVNDLSGRVTRIRTRATTILDFDNREIVLPNKDFITGQLVNWTLSDSTTRLTIVVGVAYGTDPARVHELLRKVANEHPLVLEEPAPVSWFMDFGPSSLDFNLMLFVASPRDRLPVKDAVNTRIAELFAEHGIEIAFPQMDVHMRTLPGKPDADAASGSGPARTPDENRSKPDEKDSGTAGRAWTGVDNEPGPGQR